MNRDSNVEGRGLPQSGAPQNCAKELPGTRLANAACDFK